MKAVIYARFSPRPDQATSNSNQLQIEQCIEFAAEQGWEIKSIHEDKAKSRDDASREGIAGALNDLSRGDILLCYYSSRFGAGLAAAIFEEEIRKKGAGMAFVVGGKVEDTIDARLVREIMYAINNYQRAVIGARSKARAIRKQRDGTIVSKHLPYGYTHDPENPKMMVDHPEEWPVVKLIFKLKRDGLTTGGIMRELEKRGCPRRGSRWHRNSIKRILEREARRLRSGVE